MLDMGKYKLGPCRRPVFIAEFKRGPTKRDGGACCVRCTYSLQEPL